MEDSSFHDKLKMKMDVYVHFVYQLTKKFPHDELYGVVSQLRRAALSVILNYIEGFARIRRKVNVNFLETSYGSLKESKYLLYFSLKEGFINQKEYNEALSMAEEIGAMFWKTIEGMQNDM